AEIARRLAEVAEGRCGVADPRTRVFATTALGGFAREIAEPLVRPLVARRWLFLCQPKGVRAAARGVAARWSGHDLSKPGAATPETGIAGVDGLPASGLGVGPDGLASASLDAPAGGHNTANGSREGGKS